MNYLEALERQAQYYRAMFDLIPLPAFIVDGEVRIHNFNQAAEVLLGVESAEAIERLCGDAFHCVHAKDHGCGQSSDCRNCVIRNSVRRAISGTEVHRDYCTFETLAARGSSTSDWLVTTGLLPYASAPQALLVLENVTEMVKLHSWKNTRLVRV